MERIYRGYPQALHAMERSGDLMPYMLYRREEQAGRRSAALEKRRFQDLEYFKGLYPRSVRRCQSFVEACCDRYDHVRRQAIIRYCYDKSRKIEMTRTGRPVKELAGVH